MYLYVQTPLITSFFSAIDMKSLKKERCILHVYTSIIKKRSNNNNNSISFRKSEFPDRLCNGGQYKVPIGTS